MLLISLIEALEPVYLVMRNPYAQYRKGNTLTVALADHEPVYAKNLRADDSAAVGLALQQHFQDRRLREQGVSRGKLTLRQTESVLILFL